MIQLAADFVITQQFLLGSAVQSSAKTDTLFISSVNVNFASGVITATIRRGTIINGAFSSNYPDVQVTVAADGTYSSSDGSITGTLASGTPPTNVALAQIASAFEQLVLGTGVIQGTQV